MFNKPSLGNRNDLITRKDVSSVLGNNAAVNNADLTTKSALEAAAKQPAAVSKAPQVEPAGNPENVMGARLIVGPDVKLKGAEILDCDTLVVEGRVEATMDSRVIRIADQGSFAGKVSIDIAEIHGAFEGELTARSQLIIHATGRVSGKIRYGKLVIDEGGELCGDINAISAENRTPPRPVSDFVPTLNAVAG
ncbi:bactofilin family protein [Dechloromonas denitrificans]|uniref:bactofilin family protein n=1 Tax=Dechloromonas denitrificans TaxID=281362 RepID=UPI001CF81A5A|nr:polymer-forming cytoskeletal protein [Dechloromonas denitrificans]UCV02022.1 polymer-forming cytoskeletal protein [Dechloromonas denitrificans]UCV06357.1 polymer-forming cytoskeletal protein [Dechloromonas denitrificans]